MRRDPRELPPGDGEWITVPWRDRGEYGAQDSDWRASKGGLRPPDFDASESDWSDDAGSGMLVNHLRLLWRHKGHLLVAAFLGAIVAAMVTIPRTPIYQARALIEIQGINEDFLNMRQVNPNAPGTEFSQSEVQTDLRLLRSDSLLERVANKLKNRVAAAPAAEGRVAAWRKALGLPGPQPVTMTSQVLATANADLKLRALPNTRLIEIAYDSKDPQFAADFANTLASEFIEMSLESRWQTTAHTGEWLGTQLQDLKIKLERAEQQMNDYAQANGLLMTSEKENVADEKLRQVQEELSKAQADRVDKQSKYELAALASVDSLPQVLDDGALRDYQQKLTDLRRQRAELAVTLTPEHPRLAKIEAQTASVQAAFNAERTNVIRRIKNEYDAAQRREKLLAADYAEQAKLVSQQGLAVARYSMLKREVDATRQLYDSMFQRVKEAGVAAALRASNIRVIDLAKRPGFPYKPDLPVNTAAGTLAGLCLGVLLVGIRERLDRTIQGPGDLALTLRVPELGSILSARTDPTTRAMTGTPTGRPRALAGPAAPEPDERLELVSNSRKLSPIAESFRAVVTSIMFSGTTGESPRMVVLTSSNPGEGKTTIAANLAIVLAETGQRVLLIDGDLRKPRMHAIFGLKNDRGLADALRQPVARPLQHVHPTSIPNLSVLPSGQAANGYLLHSVRLQEFLHNARHEFEIVLIDTPPMLHMPDARIIARQGDAEVILVVRAQRTMRLAAAHAVQRLWGDGIRVMGTILNDWDPGQTKGFGYYRYHEYSEKN